MLSARAKREQRIREFLAHANSEAKRSFVETFFDLEKMLCKYALVSETLYLFFDNNVLQDVLKRNSQKDPKRAYRFYALLAFLMLAEDYYCLDIFACISPAVLYEASGLGDRRPEDTQAELESLMSEIGLVAHPVGYSCFDELRSIFQLIRGDEKTIRNALEEIDQKVWKRDFSGDTPGSMRIPFSITEDECPVIELAYFHPWYVKFILMNVIEKRLFHANKNHSARRIMANPQRKEYSFLKIRRGRVEGLADLELFSFCELTTQTLLHSPTTVMGVTFDQDLRHALLRRAQSIGSISMDLGVDEPGESSLRMAYWLQMNERRTQKANRRLGEYMSIMRSFIDSFKLFD